VAEEDDDDIYDGIKRLYSDEPSETTITVSMATCGEEHRQEETGAAAMASLHVVAG
jgi:hypothetical protein